MIKYNVLIIQMNMNMENEDEVNKKNSNNNKNNEKLESILKCEHTQSSSQLLWSTLCVLRSAFYGFMSTIPMVHLKCSLSFLLPNEIDCVHRNINSLCCCDANFKIKNWSNVRMLNCLAEERNRPHSDRAQSMEISWIFNFVLFLVVVVVVSFSLCSSFSTQIIS